MKQKVLFTIVLLFLLGRGSVNIYNHVQADPSERIEKGYHIIWIIPHTHFDPYWLDPWHSEVERWCTNVRNALDIMKMEPQMTFVLDQIVGVKYFWEHYPEYREAIIKYIQEGRIEIVQGFISQPELNLVGEQGLIADALFGIHWARQVLSANVTVGWEPDVFGFGAGTPTFYKNLGLRNVVMCRTAKSLWDGVFRWVGLDNSTIYGYKMPHYTHDFGNEGFFTMSQIQYANRFFSEIHKWIDPTISPFQHTINPQNLSDDHGDMMVLYGSDFSNPNLELLGYVDAWNAQEADKTGYVIKVGTPRQFFDRLNPLIDQGGIIHTEVTPSQDLNPVFPGYYTSRVQFKAMERLFEAKMQNLETFASISKQLISNFTYPEDDFQRIWLKVATGHHHDSMTGTSRQPVYEDNMQLFDQELPVLRQIEDQVYQTLADQIKPHNQAGSITPIVIYNALSWNRTEPVCINVTADSSLGAFLALPNLEYKDVEVIDPETNNIIPSQMVPLSNFQNGTLGPRNYQLLFQADVPGLGYKQYLLRLLNTTQTESPMNLSTSKVGDLFTLENKYYRIQLNQTLNPALGTPMITLFDKSVNWTVLSSDMASWLLKEYVDLGDTYFYKFQSERSNFTTLTPTITLEEQGPVRARVIISYSIGNSQYNRSILLYDNQPRVDFEEAIQFYPANSSAVTVDISPNFEGNGTIDFDYDTPFGRITHNTNDTFYPALYSVVMKNATRGVAWINSGIHGYRRLNNTLEGVLVRYLNHTTPQLTEGSGVVLLYDNGSFTFRYALTSFAIDQPSLARERAVSQLEYNWNFPVGVYVVTSNKSGTLPFTKQFFTSNSSDILVWGLRKAPNANYFAFQLTNLRNTPVNIYFTSDLSFEFQGLANFLNDPLPNQNLTADTNPTVLQLELGGYTWATICLRNDSRDVNGPHIGEIDTPQLVNREDLQIQVVIDDAENSTIDTVWLEYCYNETFEGQEWNRVSMEKQKDGTYQAKLANSLLVDRPIYLRVVAVDIVGNRGSSLAWEVIRQPFFTSTEIYLSIAIILLVEIFGLMVLFKRYRKIQSTESKPLNILSQALEKFGLSKSALLEGTIVFILLWSGLGLWFLGWLLLKGYFGVPQMLSLNNGYNRPGAGAWFGWEQTLRNNLFDFYVPNFFFGTFVIGCVILLGVVILFHRNLQLRDILIATITLAILPLFAWIFFPILFLIGGSPTIYWSQIASIYPLYQSVELPKQYLWFFLPFGLAGIVIAIVYEVKGLIPQILLKIRQRSLVEEPTKKFASNSEVDLRQAKFDRIWNWFTFGIITGSYTLMGILATLNRMPTIWFYDLVSLYVLPSLGIGVIGLIIILSLRIPHLSKQGRITYGISMLLGCMCANLLTIAIIIWIPTTVSVEGYINTLPWTPASAAGIYLLLNWIFAPNFLMYILIWWIIAVVILSLLGNLLHSTVHVLKLVIKKPAHRS